MAKKDREQQRPQPPQVTNRKAFHDYELVEKVQAGVSLLGTEVKSLRNRGGELEGAFARIIGNECWLIGARISPYAFGTGVNHDPDRKRKLLLHRAQIRKIVGKLQQRGITLVPLRIYFNERGLAKVELALARGKRQYDKRAKLQKEQQRKDTDRAMKKYKK